MKIMIALLALAAAVSIAHFTWKGAGTNEWQLARDENGIQIFTLKTPGQELLKVRASMKVDTRLSSAVALLRDDPFGVDSDGSEVHVIERIETPEVFLAYIAVEHVPVPLGSRQLVALVNYSQNADKRVEINVQAAPTKAPPSGTAARVKHLNNLIRLIPSADGRLEWEVSSDVDMDVPYPLANLALPRELFDQLSHQRALVLTQKYAKASLVSVREL